MDCLNYVTLTDNADLNGEKSTYPLRLKQKWRSIFSSSFLKAMYVNNISALVKNINMLSSLAMFKFNIDTLIYSTEESPPKVFNF